MPDKVAPRRPIAIVTGAGGGMGRVCASRLADRYALVLSEFRKDALDQIAGQLTDDGAEVVAAVPGDLGSEAALQSIVAACADRPLLAALVHTAGLSPSTGAWQDILGINLVATVRLLDALEPLVGPGFAAVLIASTARLLVSDAPEDVLALLEHPLANDFIQRMAPMPGEEAGRGGAAYRWSKWWVGREAGRRALAWGPRGARIMSSVSSPIAGRSTSASLRPKNSPGKESAPRSSTCAR